MKRRKLIKEERQYLLNKYNQKCAYCGCDLNYESLTADHIIPLHKNGTDNIENMNPACRSCNHYKSTYTTEQFREQIKAIPGRLMKSSATFRLAVKYGLITRK